MSQPNVVFFHVDNLGYGELGCYGGGVLRGAETTRIDRFAEEGFQLLNYAPEAQCTPCRSALLTGRHAIRSGNHTVAKAGPGGQGLVAWERTLGDIFSDAGYASACLGKWHVGDGPGRWPTDKGFDTWYGPPHSYDEALWETDPWYQPGRDPVSHMLESRKGEEPQPRDLLSYDLKVGLDVEYKRRAFEFIRSNGADETPFLLYFNHTLMHIPVVPRDEYRGRSGNGDWADCLLQLDGDFGELLDVLDEVGIAENTIVVFAGDNGNEDYLLHRGTGGFWEGSYFTGMEASLRTPCIVRWPGTVPANRQSNEIMHVTDWFTTLVSMAGLQCPTDREIDGRDQTSFLTGASNESNRDGFIYWNGAHMYGVKWRNFKLPMVQQKYIFDPALPVGFPFPVNLIVDPKEREPYEARYGHTWTFAHFLRIIGEFEQSVAREPLIPAAAPLDFVPARPQGG